MVYNALDRYRYIYILVGYGVGTRALQLLRKYWGWLTMVAKSGGYYVPPFKVYRGVT